jgi:histidinol-phosphatase (PHP family)
MPFSHHSHSGEFCEGHAKDKLEDIVNEVIRQKAEVFALTEHMPRDQRADLYPEEVLTSFSLTQMVD